MLSPLLFIAVLDLNSRKTVMNDAKKTLGEWNVLLTRHGLKLSLEKTDVLHIMPPEGTVGHRAGGEETDSGGQFLKRREC